ncbi:MAG: helix-turn-helix transcriptional regulator [Clostridia bacterium]|nr:helix-turn-helix transcriptional regulator [Clostridia bacterium]
MAQLNVGNKAKSPAGVEMRGISRVIYKYLVVHSKFPHLNISKRDTIIIIVAQNEIVKRFKVLFLIFFSNCDILYLEVLKMSSFAENFSDLLRVRGFTQSSFARRLGVKQNTVSQWANGQREPDLECLVDICCILETTPNDILSFNVLEAEIKKVAKEVIETVNEEFEKMSYKERRAFIKEFKKELKNQD